jgi:hypothetical protein
MVKEFGLPWGKCWIFEAPWNIKLTTPLHFEMENLFSKGVPLDTSMNFSME